MPHKALDIATHIIKTSIDAGDPVTNKKLQKLLYYAQVWHYTLFNDTRLFSDELEAWVHGPVVPKVYGYYKDFNFSPIQLDEKIRLITLTKREQSFLRNIWDVYGKYDGDYLEALSHSEEPWREARRGLEAHAPSKAKINLNTAKAFYGKKLKGG